MALIETVGDGVCRRLRSHPGVIFRGPRGGVMSVMSFEVVDGRVATIRSVVNPDRLRHLGPVESLREVMDSATHGDRR